MSDAIVPFALRDAPALIERLLPVQKLSAEAYKEQMAGSGKTLTALGSYWKGRKPLILNKACVLGCLLPATGDPTRDLEIFELLMGMDDASFVARWPRKFKPRDLLARLAIDCIADWFDAEPPGVLPAAAPVDWARPELDGVKVAWRADVPLPARRRLEARMLPPVPYRDRVDAAKRPEEVMDSVHDHIWDAVNAHLGTAAHSFPELVGQLGILRHGHRPRVGDTFCGSGQIAFEAARLGCDVHASDLNPVACMLTWGAFNIVGGSAERRARLAAEQRALVEHVRAEIDRLGIETDGHGWRAKVYLYCVEAACPQTGWRVPLLPTRVVSVSRRAIAELVPEPESRRYEIVIRCGVSDAELAAAEVGTVRRDKRYSDASLVHTVDSTEYRTKIATLRGDYEMPDGGIANRLRLWEKGDFMPRPDDLLQERLYCVQWQRPKQKGKGYDYEFRTVTPADLARERAVERYVAENLAEWQARGWVPDMRIEVGGPPRYQGQDLVRSRGWAYWHNAFTARQLLIGGLIRGQSTANTVPALFALLNCNSKLSRWHPARDYVAETFDNQALNSLYNFACQSFAYAERFFGDRYTSFPILGDQTIASLVASEITTTSDMFISDPPYGDAVKYEEILDFFIAWLRKNPPPEFAGWTWDSRRALAIQGEGEDFRRGMVAAYSRMTACLPDNGLQVIMFTHQSGGLWADMANIVWASGLQATAAWYVATETDSALREGSHVKGTVLLVCRKRAGALRTTRDDLAWAIQEEVEAQVASLTGLNQAAKGLYRDENVFEDADIQMAGYAAALRVLTRYATIDGRDMSAEAIRPRVKGETTFVDGLIAFAVATANQCLVPGGIAGALWDRLSGAERFYLKLIDMEARGAKSLDNYQNFAKAFKVRDFRVLMGDQRANHARLRSAAEFARAEMSEGSELYGSVLRAVLYALMELQKNVDGAEVLAHLRLNVPDWYADSGCRSLAAEMAGYLAPRLETLRPEEASAARVLRDLIRNQRLG